MPTHQRIAGFGSLAAAACFLFSFFMYAVVVTPPVDETPLSLLKNIQENYKLYSATHNPKNEKQNLESYYRGVRNPVHCKNVGNSRKQHTTWTKKCDVTHGR